MTRENADAVSLAREHLAMAIRLRGSAARLRTQQAQTRLARLAALYEEISLCYLEGKRVALASEPLHLDQTGTRSGRHQ